LLLYIFTEFFKIYYIFSEILAIIIAIIHNYLLNKLWTFEEKIEEHPVKKFTQYSVISLISLIMNLTILFVLVEFYNVWYILAAFIAINCTFIWNFVGNKFWTFKKKNLNE
ncbi:MAG: GtrA family protein, partial [Promethearchaeota archaeon]